MATKKTATTSAAEAKKAAASAKLSAARAKAAEARTKAASGHVGGFMTFIREQGVVGLAVGLAIGTAAGASVKTIVDNLINPAVALLTQGVDLSKMSWDVKVGEASVQFGWGAVVSSLITLLATAFVIYLIIHFAKLDKLDKKKA